MKILKFPHSFANLSYNEMCIQTYFDTAIADYHVQLHWIADNTTLSFGCHSAVEALPAEIVSTKALPTTKGIEWYILSWDNGIGFAREA